VYNTTATVVNCNTVIDRNAAVDLPAKRLHAGTVTGMMDLMKLPQPAVNWCAAATYSGVLLNFINSARTDHSPP
jgi:hypothetical protein